MTQDTPETPENPGADAKVKASIAIWKRRLLDLTRRNRALNFRPSPVATVTIVDEQPAQVFRQICLQNRAMRFKAAPDRSEDESAPTHPDDAQESEGMGLEFAPYDPADLHDRHTDDFLQTTARAENLDRSLRRLDEQGVNTLSWRSDFCITRKIRNPT